MLLLIELINSHFFSFFLRPIQWNKDDYRCSLCFVDTSSGALSYLIRLFASVFTCVYVYVSSNNYLNVYDDLPESSRRPFRQNRQRCFSNANCTGCV